MVDTLSANIALTIIPRGGDAGTWDTGTNGNVNALDGLIGGLQSVSLTNANVTLTVPATFVATPGAGPTQSQNAVIRFTGTLTGNCVITFPRPGIYVVENRCTVGAFYVQLTNGGGGEVIGIPPGEAVDVYSDGTNVRFRNLERIGAFVDLCGVSVVPAWVGACTVPPYVLCDGTVYNNSVYPVLGVQLGATFGGNGSTTFGTPDLRGKWRVSLDPTGTRLTSATMSPNGNTLAATGGKQNEAIAQANLPNVNFANSGITLTNGNILAQTIGGLGGGGANVATLIPGNTGNPFVSNVSVNSQGSANSGGGNVALTTLPPTLITGITLIRAG